MRLTKYDDKKGQYIVEDKYIKFINMKLGKLEDLEEEQGCSLEVVFKALKDGIWFYDKWNYGERMLNYIPVLENKRFVCGLNEYIRWLEDYKKTWWLKADRSE